MRMKNFKLVWFVIFGLLIFVVGNAFADEARFTRIFDGRTLDGWKSPNMSYWSIMDSAITAESTEANPCTSNQFLVWQGGEVADFELKLKFRRPPYRLLQWLNSPFYRPPYFQAYWL